MDQETVDALKGEVWAAFLLSQVEVNALKATLERCGLAPESGRRFTEELYHIRADMRQNMLKQLDQSDPTIARRIRDELERKRLIL